MKERYCLCKNNFVSPLHRAFSTSAFSSPQTNALSFRLEPRHYSFYKSEMLICYEQSIALRCFSWGKTITSDNTWSALSPEGKREGLVMVSFVSWSHCGNELDNEEYGMDLPCKESLFNKDTYMTVWFQYKHVLLVLQSLPPSTLTVTVVATAINSNGSTTSIHRAKGCPFFQR